jgi:hypothetical protein
MSAVEKRSRAHQRYKTSDGRPAVGVTTVLSQMNKPCLVAWANKLGLQGIDSTKYVDALARIGSCTHYLVECDAKGITPKLGDFTANEIETAKKSFQKWINWRSQNKFELVESELNLVSDAFQFGGTCDIYAIINGTPTVLDIKTSKICYSEQRTQVIAYMRLMIENKKPVTDARIIRIGRDENEGFEDILVGAHDLHWKRFKACLALYWANKNLENAGA